MEYDLLEYLRGDGRVYELQYDIQGNQGRQTVQTQADPDNPNIFYHVKGHEWERIYADDHYIYREADTSEAPDRYYVQTTNGRPGAIWARRHMAIEQVTKRDPLVIHYWKGNCTERLRGNHPSSLILVDVKQQHTFPGGITLQDVMILGWLVDDTVEEQYLYAKGYGLVGWQGRGRGESYLCQLPDDRPDLVREVIPCLPTLGELYLAPPPADEVPDRRVLGVDVSSHQGPNLDWQRLYQDDGIRFAFLRASVGLRADSTYQRNHRRAGEAGILRGAYHYFYPQFDAGEQARLFAATLLASELPAVLDIEHANTTEAQVRAFLEEFESRAGTRAMLYTSRHKWHALIGTDASWIDERQLWVAHYTNTTEPDTPEPWSNWTFWQFTQSGRVSAYPGNLDLDRFNGDLADLVAYASATPITPTEPAALLTDGFDFPCGGPDGERYYVAAGVAEEDYHRRFDAWHTGEDWNSCRHGESDLNAPVLAVANGIVVASGFFTPSWGNIILIKHTLPDGTQVWSQYAHLQERMAAENKVVERGDQIGTIGKGENDRWPAHLHFEIRRHELPPDAWGFTRQQVLEHYLHPTEFITEHRPASVGVEVTLDSPAFSRSTSRFWHEMEIGYQGHAFWTYTLGTKEDCWAEWRPVLPQPGFYKVLAFVPASNATSQQARYQINHRRGNSIVIIDQSPYFNQWVSLGHFPFSTSSSMPAVVRLSDLTGEPFTRSRGTRKRIAFDAMRFVLLESS